MKRIFIGLLLGLGLSLWFKYFYNIGEKSVIKGMDKMNRYHGIRYFTAKLSLQLPSSV